MSVTCKNELHVCLWVDPTVFFQLSTNPFIVHICMDVQSTSVVSVTIVWCLLISPVITWDGGSFLGSLPGLPSFASGLMGFGGHIFCLLLSRANFTVSLLLQHICRMSMCNIFNSVVIATTKIVTTKMFIGTLF